MLVRKEWTPYNQGPRRVAWLWYTLYCRNALTLVKDSEFLHNHCSGITAVQSSIVLSGSITIAKNTAYNGGGVLLCANSIIFLSLHVSVTIEENLASNFGGGIYAEFECSQAVPPCFYGTETNETSVFLVNNNASRVGDALYGGSIDSCYTNPNSLLIKVYSFSSKKGKSLT